MIFDTTMLVVALMLYRPAYAYGSMTPPLPELIMDDGVHYMGFSMTEDMLMHSRMSAEQLEGLHLHDPIVMSNNDVPAQLDLYKDGYLPGVKDQGQCGSCWAFAATDALAGRHAMKNGYNVDLSEKHALDCTYEGQRDGCNGGWGTSVYDTVGKKGIAGQNFYAPYNAKDETCPSDQEFDIMGYKRVSHVGLRNGKVHQYFHDEQALKKELVKYGPCFMAMRVFGEFSRVPTDDNYVFKCGSGSLNHAMTLIGYGTTSKGDDYWLIKNSWGSGWGDGGFVRVDMKSCNLGSHMVALCPEVAKVDSRYSIVKTQDCEAHGLSFITTRAECIIAANIVGMTNEYTRNNPPPSGNRQKFCGTWEGTRWTHFNPQEFGIGPNGYPILQTAGAATYQICKNSYPYSIVKTQDCEAHGLRFIKTRDECIDAANAVGMRNEYTRNNPPPSGNRQKFCGTWAGTMWTHFNPQEAGIGPNGYPILQTAGPATYQICKSA